jgi:hypothetical protein
VDAEILRALTLAVRSLNLIENASGPRLHPREEPQSVSGEKERKPGCYSQSALALPLDSGGRASGSPSPPRPTFFQAGHTAGANRPEWATLSKTT